MKAEMVKSREEMRVSLVAAESSKQVVSLTRALNVIREPLIETMGKIIYSCMFNFSVLPLRDFDKVESESCSLTSCFWSSFKD